MKKKKESYRPLLAYQVERALKEAVAEAIAQHRRDGVPIAVWRDGKVVLVAPDQIGVSDVQAAYTLSKKREKLELC